MPSRIGNASRSALQTSSCSALRETSGPLQSGHTRMSSSFESMQSAGDECGEALVHARLDAERVEVVAGERAAFYCILLGHQDRVAVRELEVAGRERVMVGERVRREREAERLERGEEPRRIADSGDGM